MDNRWMHVDMIGGALLVCMSACRAYDPAAFRAWASKGICPGIPAMVKLFWTLKGRGFKVFLLSGRDEETLAAATASNLAAAGFAGYDRLILR